MRRKVLVLGGMVGLGGGETPLVIQAQFATRTQQFFADVVGVDRLSDLGTRIRHKDPSISISPFSGGTAGEETFSAEIILAGEAADAGFDTSFAQLSWMFPYQNGTLSLNPEAAALLDDVDLVGISTTFIPAFEIGYRLIGAMTKLLQAEGKCVVLGGPVVSKLPPHVVRTLPCDFQLRYEAEGIFGPFLRALADGGDLSSVPGLVWRDDGSVRISEATWDPFDLNSRIYLPTPEWVARARGYAHFEGMRGCPFRCEFCSYPYLLGNKKARIKSAEVIHEEWASLRDLGIQYINCHDSVFSVPARRMETLCRLLIDSGLGKELRWSCFARARELANPEFAELMKEAGCVHVSIGLESMSESVLETMNKKVNAEQNHQAITTCNQVGLYASGCIIAGFPGESNEDFQKTYDALANECLPEHPVFPYINQRDQDSEGNSVIPILQPDRVERFKIVLDPKKVELPEIMSIEIFGETVLLPPSVRDYAWGHSGMSYADAFNNVSRLISAMHNGTIAAHDPVWTPYRDLLRDTQGMSFAFADSARERRPFQEGLKVLYRRFIQGEPAEVLRRDVPAWLEKSGLERRDPVVPAGSDRPRRPTASTTPSS